MGDHCCLKIVTMAQRNPPMLPASRYGVMSAIWCDCANRRQVQAAVATAQSSRMPVLLTVPLSVMEPAFASSPDRGPAKSRKVFSLNAGLAVLISAMVVFSPIANTVWLEYYRRIG